MDTIKKLIIKRLRQALTPEEEVMLQAWMAESPENRAIVEDVNDPERLAEAFAKLDSLQPERVWERVKAFSENNKGNEKSPVLKKDRVHLSSATWVRYAAAIIVMVGLGCYFWLQHEKKIRVAIAKIAPQDVPAPALSYATITLADGRQIAIDSARNGAIAMQGDMCIEKISDGHIAYIGTGKAQEAQYNTLTVPRGSKITSVVLSDGSKVFLNAASSLTYPVAFEAGERRAEITGEGYFEIARDPSRKFIVAGGGVTTEVLGTHFNVNTYPDEVSIKVTLLEGSVKVSDGRSKMVIKPGGQAISKDGVMQVNPSVDMDQVMVWMNGLFDFQDKHLPEVMRQLARWYDLQVIYEKNIPEIEYFGQIGRNLKLSEVLKVLESTGVHFRIEEGRRVVVLSR